VFTYSDHLFQKNDILTYTEKNRRYHYILSQDLHIITPVSIFVIIYIARK